MEEIYDEEDSQTAEYLGLARCVMRELVPLVNEGKLIAPLDVLYADRNGTALEFRVDNFGHWRALEDNPRRALHRVRFPVNITITDRNGLVWETHVDEFQALNS